VECKKLDIPSIGIEANPMAHFASQSRYQPFWSGVVYNEKEIV
jgi:hypothetical protein